MMKKISSKSPHKKSNRGSKDSQVSYSNIDMSSKSRMRRSPDKSIGYMSVSKKKPLFKGIDPKLKISTRHMFQNQKKK